MSAIELPGICSYLAVALLEFFTRMVLATRNPRTLSFSRLPGPGASSPSTELEGTPIAAFGVSPCRSEPAPILCDVSNAMVSIAGECSVLQTGRESWTHVQYFERSTARAPTIMIEHGRSNKSSASSDEGPPCAAIGVKRSAAERLVPSDGVDGMRRTSSEEKISAGIPGEGRGGGSNKG